MRCRRTLVARVGRHRGVDEDAEMVDVLADPVEICQRTIRGGAVSGGDRTGCGGADTEFVEPVLGVPRV